MMFHTHHSCIFSYVTVKEIIYILMYGLKMKQKCSQLKKKRKYIKEKKNSLNTFTLDKNNEKYTNFSCLFCFFHD